MLNAINASPGSTVKTSGENKQESLQAKASFQFSASLLLIWNHSSPVALDILTHTISSKI